MFLEKIDFAKMLQELEAYAAKEQEKAKEYFTLHVEGEQKHPKSFLWSFIAWNAQKGMVIPK